METQNIHRYLETYTGFRSGNEGRDIKFFSIKDITATLRYTSFIIMADRFNEEETVFL